MAPIITVQNLCREYHISKRIPGFWGAFRTFWSRETNLVSAIDQVSFAVERGELIGYIGPNGAGKSTTFKMLSGVLVPSSGTVIVDDLIPTKQRQQLSRRIGVIFSQRSQLWWDLPLIESLRILQAMYRVPDKVYNRNMSQFGDTLGLDAFLHTPVRQLSLGQRMRSELAAVFIHDPKIVLLDEPLLGLDIVAKERVRQFIADRNQLHGTTVVLASNDIDDIERLCQRMLLINKGKLLYDGTVDAVKKLHAPHRVLFVQFGEYYQDITIKSATMIRRKGLDAWFHFERSINPQKIINELGENHIITNLSIEEPILEEIICKIYQQTDVLHDMKIPSNQLFTSLPGNV